MDYSDSDSDLEQYSRDVSVGKHGQHDIARILKDSVVSPGKPLPGLPGPSKDQRFDESGIGSSPVSLSLSRKRPTHIELEPSVRKPKVTRANVDSSESLAATSRTQRFDNLGNDSRTVSSNSSGNGSSDVELEESDANDGQANPNLHLDIKGEYDASGLKNNLHGGIYQLKHLMLILNRARIKGYRFRLATEMDLAEKFDDLVFEYEDETGRTVHRFVQLKHKQDENKRITAGQLSADEGDFSVKKYYISWHNIKNNKKFASSAKDFLLCTNTGLDLQGLRKNGITPIEWTESDELLEITNTEKQPLRYKLQIDGSSKLWTRLKSASDANNIHHREISRFLEEFILAVNQPNEVELGKLIAHEFGASSQFNLSNADLPMYSFQDKILHWFKKKEGVFLVQEDLTKFFAEMERELSAPEAMGLSSSYSAKLKKHEIMFENEIKSLRDFLDNSQLSVNLILQLTSYEQTLLSALRIYQAIQQSERYKKKVSFIFIELENLLLPGKMDVLFRAFQSPCNHHLLIIDFGLDSATRDTHQLSHNIHENMEKLDEEKITGKRIIFIIPRKDLEVMALEIAYQTIHEKAGDVSIDKLARLTQEKLLDKEIIKLQGHHQQKTSFTRLLGTNNFVNVVGDELENYTRIVNQETLVKLIRDEEIRIGGEVEGFGEVEDYYIPRTIRRVVIKADILRDPQIPDIFALDGVDSESLANLVANKSESEKITSQGQQIDTTKYIILESGRKSDHFDSLCKQNMNINIHWLQVGSGKLIWIRSFGSIANLKKFKDKSKDFNDDEKQSEISLTEDKLAEHNEQIGKIVILSDTAGMGKSTLLTWLAQKIKENEPSLWVIRIDLTAHTRVLDIEKNSRSFGSNNVEGALDFLVDKLIRKLEGWDVSVLKYLIRAQQGAALLFDGFDEISPNYGRIVIDLLLALAKLDVKKLFVTTRPHTSGELEKTLEIFSHTLEPFSPCNQIDFLTKFWGRTLPAKDSNSQPDETEEPRRERAQEVLNLLDKSIDPSMKAFTGVPLQTRMVAEVIPFDGSELPETLDIIKLYRRFVYKKYSIFSTEKTCAEHTNLAVRAINKQGRPKYLKMHRKLALDLLFDEDTASRLLRTQPKADCSAENWKRRIRDVQRTGIVTLDRDDRPHFIHRTFAEYFAATFLVKTLTDHSRNQHVREFFVFQFFVKPEYQITRAFVNCLLKGEDYAPGNQIWNFDLCDCLFKVGTLYHVAAKERHLEIVRFFLNTLKERSRKPFSNINCRSTSGDTALHISSQAGDIDLVEYLLEHGANTEIEDRFGWTPLARAANLGKVDVMKHLLEKGANIEGTNENWKTPLGIAAPWGEVDVVKHLLKNRANIEAGGVTGRTPLILAADSGNVDVVKLLLEKRANTEAVDNDGRTPLIVAADLGNVDVVKLLLEKRANTEAVDENGWTPLIAAADSGNVHVVDLLLEKRANIEAADKAGRTPLVVAARSGNVDVVELLLEKRANIEVADKAGRTPLVVAARTGNVDVVELLLEKRANIEAVDEEGRTPLDIATSRGNTDVIEPLLFEQILNADIEMAVARNPSI